MIGPSGKTVPEMLGALYAYALYSMLLKQMEPFPPPPGARVWACEAWGTAVTAAVAEHAQSALTEAMAASAPPSGCMIRSLRVRHSDGLESVGVRCELKDDGA